MVFSTATTADPWFTNRAPSYSFAKDSRGKTLIATMADLKAATKPGDKLTIAAQVAESVRLQTDAAIKTGRADRLATMTAQAQQVMDAASAVVDGLKGATSVSGADPALKSYQAKITKVLTSLAGSLPSLRALTGRASKDVAAKTNDSLKTIDAAAAAVAAAGGINWQAIKKAASTTAGTGTAATTSRLLDFLA